MWLNITIIILSIINAMLTLKYYIRYVRMIIVIINHLN